jgi:hypothetical protein
MMEFQELMEEYYWGAKRLGRLEQSIVFLEEEEARLAEVVGDPALYPSQGVAAYGAEAHGSGGVNDPTPRAADAHHRAVARPEGRLLGVRRELAEKRAEVPELRSRLDVVERALGELSEEDRRLVEARFKRHRPLSALAADFHLSPSGLWKRLETVGETVTSAVQMLEGGALRVRIGKRIGNKKRAFGKQSAGQGVLGC